MAPYDRFWGVSCSPAVGLVRSAPMQFEYRAVSRWTALVVTPEADSIIGLETLNELRSGGGGRLDPELAARLVDAPERIDLVILRARAADGSGQFRVDRQLDDPQLLELGTLLLARQLQAWRPLLDQQLLAVVRVELRVWELAALRAGAQRLLRTLPADDERGRHLVENAMLNLGVGLDTALTEVLPDRIRKLTR